MGTMWNKAVGWGAGGLVAALAMAALMGASSSGGSAGSGIGGSGMTQKTVTVIGEAMQADTGGTSSIGINAFIAARGSTAVDALNALSSEVHAVEKAVEASGVAASQITLTNQNASANGGPLKGIPGPSAGSGSVQYSANATLQISGIASSQETAVLTATATAIATASGGSFNVYMNSNNGPGQAVPATAATINQAMDVAQAEAQAVAAKAGGTLGSLLQVKQMPYTGPLYKANQTMVELQVTYQLQ